MSSTRRPAEPSPPSTSPRVALALAGGGPLGAIHEIGALCALEEALPSLDFTTLNAYVGVSAGAFIAAGLANGMTPRQMCAAFIESDGGADDLIDPRLFTRPAWGEYRRRFARLPGLLAQMGWQVLAGDLPPINALGQLGGALPTGLFDNHGMQAQLERVFAVPGRTNDFRQLRRRLVVVATDLDTGEAAPFGQPGWDDTPIARAIIASAALPGLYPPVSIGGRHYVDGALKKTMHASVVLDQGQDLLICLNPLVPFDASHRLDEPAEGERSGPRPTAHEGRIPHLAAAGLPAVMSQTFRTLIHSRLELGMKGYGISHPECDIVLLEPDHHDPALFRAGTFSYTLRRELAEHAYQQTRRLLRNRCGELAPVFAEHGVPLDLDLLFRERRLLPKLALRRSGSDLAERTHQVLDQLEARLREISPTLVERRAQPR
ncbi:patatin-like phospholipase family protein [Ideonella sp.]|uniref:patatin-like phospholipase family protein n=1 Tax=Ideonella sp. TaxID=1929293 RepID=UPI002B497A87|nr:patatin-like phospholipase family protein [Ideonella sp.]HJV70364.1 patatin-like phospholipase family protein [Ideonella sp.]